MLKVVTAGHGVDSVAFDDTDKKLPKITVNPGARTTDVKANNWGCPTTATSDDGFTMTDTLRYDGVPLDETRMGPNGAKFRLAVDRDDLGEGTAVYVDDTPVRKRTPAKPVDAAQYNPCGG